MADPPHAGSLHEHPSTLAERHCVPCRRGAPPLRPEAIGPLAQQTSGWEVAGEHHLRKGFRFPDFRRALDFVNRVGELAEAEHHHPDILLGWGKVEITLWTHAAGGLTENDFILAAKIDRL
ncbi:MAG TPA: 4a-hydroxytetrahydrobiopterin dehydratase [Terriglobia bacterium]|nr:4a-hydroxytetrahydrobiopterin dehydratase [Terriglobia bacterium]